MKDLESNFLCATPINKECFLFRVRASVYRTKILVLESHPNFVVILTRAGFNVQVFLLKGVVFESPGLLYEIKNLRVLCLE